MTLLIAPKKFNRKCFGIRVVFEWRVFGFRNGIFRNWLCFYGRVWGGRFLGKSSVLFWCEIIESRFECIGFFGQASWFSTFRAMLLAWFTVQIVWLRF